MFPRGAEPKNFKRDGVFVCNFSAKRGEVKLQK